MVVWWSAGGGGKGLGQLFNPILRSSALGLEGAPSQPQATHLPQVQDVPDMAPLPVGVEDQVAYVHIQLSMVLGVHGLSP